MRIAAIAAAVPRRRLPNEALGLPADQCQKYEENTGIFCRRTAVGTDLTTLDLCLAATQPALDAAGWKSGDVDAAIFVSQTPDYFLPASACILQHKAGLRKDIIAFDVNLGCSGYTHGLILAHSLIQSGRVGRCLLAVGDTSTRSFPADQSGFRFLFGDAGAVTLLEKAPDQVKAAAWGTDGSGAPFIIVREGSQRSRTWLDASDPSPPPLLQMDGAQVFAFALQRAVPAVKDLLKQAAWAPEDVTAVVFHQANKFILENIARRCKIPMERVPLSLDEFGNTSSASIPLTMVVRMADQLRSAKCRLLLVGFGVGWSWSGLAIETDKVALPPLVEVEGGPPENRRDDYRLPA